MDGRMAIRRGMASLALAGTMTLALAVPAVMADTTGAANSDQYFAYGEYADGQIDLYIAANYGTADGVAFSNLFAGKAFAPQDITCKGKGKKTYPGQIYKDISGESDSAVIKIDKKLATATASATMTLTETIYNSCTDSQTQKDYTSKVSFDLHATTGTTTTKSRTEIRYPDGSKELITFRDDVRNAGGTLTFLGTTYTAGGGKPDQAGQIEHSVQTDVTTPAH